VSDGGAATAEEVLAPPRLNARRVRLRLLQLLCGGSLLVLGLLLLQAVEQSLRRTAAEGQERLNGALDLAGWAWQSYLGRLTTDLEAAVQGDPLQQAALERLVAGRSDAAAVLWSVNGRPLARAGSAAFDTPAPQLLPWLAQLGGGVAWRRLPRASGGYTVVAATRITGRGVPGAPHTLAYLLLLDPAAELQALQQALLGQRGITLELGAAGPAPAAAATLAWPGRTLQAGRPLVPGLHAVVSTRADYDLAMLDSPMLMLAAGLLIVGGGLAAARLQQRLWQPLQALEEQAAQPLPPPRPEPLVGQLVAEPSPDPAIAALPALGHDSLTGLADRRSFDEYIQRTIAQAAEHGQRCALLFIDLDDFKQVNDVYGHLAGDQLLVEVARRIQGCVRRSDAVVPLAATALPPDIVARLGGDEFLVLLTQIHSTADARAVAQRVSQAVAEPVTIGADLMQVGASIGIAVYPNDGTDAEGLLHTADLAMYNAKARGKNNYCCFARDLPLPVDRHLDMHTRLHRAIDRGRLQLHLQPVFQTGTGNLLRAEALLRWQDRKLGHVPPGVFIPMAEHSGHIVELTDWLIDEICRDLAGWASHMPPEFRVSFNVSHADLRNGQLAGVLRDAMRRYGVPGSRLMIETSETSLLTLGDRAVPILEAIRGMGVGVALDHFGSGCFSLRALQRFPFSEIKIDKSLVGSLSATGADLALVRAAAALSRSLNLSATAVGVGTPEQFRLSDEIGCDNVQGYLFSPPVPAAQFGQELRTDPLRHCWALQWSAEPAAEALAA